MSPEFGDIPDSGCCPGHRTSCPTPEQCSRASATGSEGELSPVGGKRQRVLERERVPIDAGRCVAVLPRARSHVPMPDRRASGRVHAGASSGPGLRTRPARFHASQSWIRMLSPGPPSRMSGPGPPIRTSSPSPPKRMSSPAPPIRTSSPSRRRRQRDRSRRRGRSHHDVVAGERVDGERSLAASAPVMFTLAARPTTAAPLASPKS